MSNAFSYSSDEEMTTKTLDQYIERTPGVAGGKARIAGRRIKVADVAIWHERLGMSADEIVTEYDLTLVEVYAALAYYFAHREDIDREIDEGVAFVEAVRRQVHSKLRQKLDAGGD
jgi:uncharacterized protein (DUF433 family)